MHKSNHHILSSCLVSIPHSWAAAACQHLLISKPTQCHFYGSTHWRTWQRERERDTAVLLIALCWPSSILCRVSTALLQCIFHYFPPSFPTCHSKRIDACLPPSCSCSSMSPCSRPHSSSSFPVSLPTLRDRVPAQPEQLPSVAPSPQRAPSGVSFWKQALCKRCDTSHSTQGIWSRAGRGAQLFSVQMFSYRTMTILSFFFKRNGTNF